MATPVLTTIGWAPEVAHGLVRDLRIRWALEEAGLPYEVKVIDFEALKSDCFRKLQPFQQVPVYSEGQLTLFESGGILVYLGEKSEALLPREADQKALAISWIFSALNSVEPALQHLTILDLFHGEEPWAPQARPTALVQAHKKLAALQARLDDREFLEDRFTAGDLMLTTVLRIPRHCDLLSDYPAVDEYRRRNEQRPAFQKALDDQLSVLSTQG